MRAGAAGADRVLDSLRSGFDRLVRAHETGLEAGTVALVDPVEKEQRYDAGVARVALNDRPVVARLRRLVDRRRVLVADVAGHAARAGLPARFVEDPAHRRRARPFLAPAALREGGLGGAVEAVPEGLLSAVEVGDADIRPGCALLRRVEVGERIRMEPDGVHDRLRTPTRTVCLAHGGDETHGRDRVSLRAGAVVAPGRDGEADHVDVRVDSLQRVVARGESLLVGCCGGDRSVALEGRKPEASEVRFVADDEVVHLRECPRNERRVRRELPRALRIAGHVPVVSRRDAEQHSEPAFGRGPDSALDLGLLLNRLRLGRLVGDGHANHAEPVGAHFREERAAAVVVTQRLVLRRADREDRRPDLAYSGRGRGADREDEHCGRSENRKKLVQPKATSSSSVAPIPADRARHHRRRAQQDRSRYASIGVDAA